MSLKWSRKKCSTKGCKNPVLETSKHCEKHKARIGLHRKTFVSSVKLRVLNEHGTLICEKKDDCPVYGIDKYEEHWLDVDHIQEINSFDKYTLVSVINNPSNGELICKFCHANKNNILRPKKVKELI
ncbi:hypothetical protein [Paenibacillus illinoisensis]|uniref:hypothetical protein n=1 Tax=Paenibacillus illinoisensis TaxID=59845 RepID=UPI00301C73D7